MFPTAMKTLSPRTTPPIIVSCGSFNSLIGAFVAGALGLTMNSSTSASLPVRHLIACTSVDIVKRKMFDAVTSFLLMIVSIPILSARLI